MAFDWDGKSLEDQYQFALDWESNPTGQWNQVSEVASTRDVLRILNEIASLRTTIEVYRDRLGPTFSLSEINTSELDMALYGRLLTDTDGVVNRHYRHAGGWWGLMTVTAEPIGISHGAYPLRMPPGTSTFMSAFNHLTTRARGGGSAGIRAAPESLIEFVNAERAAAGSDALTHMAITLNNLMRQNADDLFHKYLLALRGHGTEEPGRRHTHHLADIVAARSDADARLARRLTVDTFRASLFRFPQVFSSAGTDVSDWPGKILRHLSRWEAAMGNHRPGERWLRDEATAARDRWADTTAMAERLTSSRERERRVSESVTTRIARLRRNVLTLREELSRARGRSSSAERVSALTSARETVRSWRDTFSESGTASVGGSGSSTTEAGIEGGGDIIVADATIDASQAITFELESKLSATIAAEQEEGGSVTDASSTTETTRLTQQWNDLIEMTRSAERQLTNEEARSRAYTSSVTRVIAITSVEQQVRNIHAGILRFLEE